MGGVVVVGVVVVVENGCFGFWVEVGEEWGGGGFGGSDGGRVFNGPKGSWRILLLLLLLLLLGV